MSRKILTIIKIRRNVILLSLSFIFIFNFYLFINIVTSIGGELNINIANLNDIPIDEIEEGEYFKISVYDPLSETVYLTDVDICFNEINYKISPDSTNNEIEIIAPNVDYDKDFIIYASKEGYDDIQKIITILNIAKPSLFIFHEEYIVDEGKLFSVTITKNDRNGDPVEGVKVYIQNSPESGSEYTDEYGNAKLITPKDFVKFTVIASKSGYEDGTMIFDVNIEKTLWESIIEDPYFIVYIAIIILIFAVIFVNIKQKRSIFDRTKQIIDNKTIEKYSEQPTASYYTQKINVQHHSNEAVRLNPTEDSKVEEIRITRSMKDKEIIPVKSEKNEPQRYMKRKDIKNDD
ncbi:MAG: hypothetical protein JSV67_01340 [Thermoplasmatales archaeon]|nr:MAG: hypothetical protein JSV67_01340 [Thermoplasmatales archaeon]